MKPKQLMMLTLLFLGISLSRETQAFYAPSSSDPIGEKGAANLNDFVGNNAVNSSDFLGMLNTIHLGFHGAMVFDGRWMMGLGIRPEP